MINPMDLSGKNILVTGASAGIGRSIAVLLSKLGANVLLVARNQDKLQETADELEPGDHACYPFDLCELDRMEDLMVQVCREGRKLNGLVHSAGISMTTPLQYLKMEQLRHMMTVNFYSFMELVKQFSKRKFHEPGGSIVAISSISNRVGARGLAAYCASKGALESAIRALAVELAPKGLRINSVAPGVIATQIYDGLKDIVNNRNFESDLMKRQVMGVGMPEDVAHAAAFMLSEASRFVTGTSMVVDGGYLAH